MKSFARLFAAAGLTAGLMIPDVASSAGRPLGEYSAAARPPVVVELFTAQGCASCNGADTWFDGLADRPGVIALNWAVDYWDYLGWKDTFAQPAFADRQRGYDRRLGPRDVYTPQVIVGGAAEAAGDEPNDVDALIRRVRRAAPAAPPRVVIHSGHVAIGAGHPPKGGGEAWLIRFDSRAQTVEVKDGDNRGKTLQRRNVVRQLVRLGAWKGSPVRLALPAAPEPGLATVVLVQGARLGPVIAAREVLPTAGPAA